MGTEIAIPYFGPLILIGTVILLYAAVRGRRRPITDTSFLGLGRSRIASGYLGALVALVAYCYVDTADLSRMKVARGDVTSAEAAQYFFGWFLNIFCLVTPFMILFITVLGLPVLAALRRIGFASVLGALLSGQLLAACFSLCFSSSYISNAVLAGLLTMGFVLAARLPWWRSPAMPANQRLERPVKPPLDAP